VNQEPRTKLCNSALGGRSLQLGSPPECAHPALGCKFLGRIP
jgi:hypothetical protein